MTKQMLEDYIHILESAEEMGELDKRHKQYLEQAKEELNQLNNNND